MMGQSKVLISIFACLVLCKFSYGQSITAATCTYDGTTIAPNATNCQDEDPQGCPVLFPGGSATVRGTNCDNPSVYQTAIQCANTCKACCLTSPYSCGDNPLSPINCTANARFCRDPDWTNVMQTNCPGTCGTCTTGSCADVLDDCQPMRQLCNDATFKDYMTANCKRTCLLCSTSPTSSPSTCSDVATNCAANAGLCNNSVYLTLMTQKCPSTCGRCSGSGTGGGTTCTDSNSNCATWVANGFCSNSFYTAAQKLQYCGRSCNLC
jgi:hypothetical protein